MSDLQGIEWLPAATAPDRVTVLTKVDDSEGMRMVQKLQRHGRLWFTPNLEMYVYYTPTHWATALQGTAT